MAKIWANRLIAGDKTWAEVPQARRASVKAELQKRVQFGEITQDEYERITMEAA